MSQKLSMEQILELKIDGNIKRFMSCQGESKRSCEKSTSDSIIGTTTVKTVSKAEFVNSLSIIVGQCTQQSGFENITIAHTPSCTKIVGTNGKGQSIVSEISTSYVPATTIAQVTRTISTTTSAVSENFQTVDPEQQVSEASIPTVNLVTHLVGYIDGGCEKVIRDFNKQLVDCGLVAERKNIKRRPDPKGKVSLKPLKKRRRLIVEEDEETVQQKENQLLTNKK